MSGTRGKKTRGAKQHQLCEYATEGIEKDQKQQQRPPLRAGRSTPQGPRKILNAIELMGGQQHNIELLLAFFEPQGAPEELPEVTLKSTCWRSLYSGRNRLVPIRTARSRHSKELSVLKMDRIKPLNALDLYQHGSMVHDGDPDPSIQTGNREVRKKCTPQYDLVHVNGGEAGISHLKF